MNMMSMMKDFSKISSGLKDFKEEVKTWDLSAYDNDEILKITINEKGKILKCVFHKDIDLQGKEYRNKIANAMIEAQENAINILSEKTKEKLKDLNIPPALNSLLGI